METLIIAVVGLLVIAACNQLAPKVGVASPLILLVLGAVVGFLPWVQPIEIEPDLILEAVLPPLLFAAAVSMPVMDFRRELRSVAGLAVGLVIVSTGVLGVVIHLLVPTISLPWAITLGAVLSPTDAVAVSIARGSGVTHRIVTVLEGEGLFNDATALVLLSAAVSAGLMADAESLRPASLAWELVLALVVALVIGWGVGELTVRLRSRITDPAADTAVSFAVPFLASLPAETLGGSGLVAAVVAGLVMSYRGPRLLPPGNRRAAHQNWRTVELILEGWIFLAMGLQAYGIFHEVEVGAQAGGVRLAVALALLVGALTVVVRALFVAPLLVWLRSVRRRTIRRLDVEAAHISQFEERLAHACDVDQEMLQARNLSQEDWTRALGRWRRRLEAGQRKHERTSNDLAYFTAATLGRREGAVIVWAGMRGAVTLAAAQTLPMSAPMRPFLLLVALVVASGSLVVQGLTLRPLIRVVRPQMASDGQDAAERRRLLNLLGHAVKDTALTRVLQEHAEAGAVQDGGAAGLTRSFSTVGRALLVGEKLAAGWSGCPDPAPVPLSAQEQESRSLGEPPLSPSLALPTEPSEGYLGEDSGEPLAAADMIRPLSQPQVRALAIEAIHAQRDALLDARDEGVFTSQTLEYALERLDSEEIMLQTRH